MYNELYKNVRINPELQPAMIPKSALICRLSHLRVHSKDAPRFARVSHADNRTAPKSNLELCTVPFGKKKQARKCITKDCTNIRKRRGAKKWGKVENTKPDASRLPSSEKCSARPRLVTALAASASRTRSMATLGLANKTKIRAHCCSRSCNRCNPALRL